MDVAQNDDSVSLETGAQDPSYQLEDPDAVRLREIKELANLLRDDLITREEYEKAKQHIFK